MRLIILRFHYILHLASAFILLSMLTTSSLLVMMTLTIFPGSNLIYTTSFRQKVWGRSNILGIEVAYPSSSIVVSQWKYALDILTEIGMLDCLPSGTPTDPNVKLLPG